MWSAIHRSRADSPAGNGTVDVTVTTPSGTSADLLSRPVHLHRGHCARSHQPEPHERNRGRRHSGDDHRHGFHRRHGRSTSARRPRRILTVVNDTSITVDSPAGTGTGGRHRDDSRRHLGHLSSRPVHLHRGHCARGHRSEPHQRYGGRRHSGDDHRHGFHRRHGRRLRHDGRRRISTVVNDTRSPPTARRAPARHWTSP